MHNTTETPQHHATALAMAQYEHPAPDAAWWAEDRPGGTVLVSSLTPAGTLHTTTYTTSYLAHIGGHHD